MVLKMNGQLVQGAEQMHTFAVKLCIKCTQPVKRLWWFYLIQDADTTTSTNTKFITGASQEQQMPRKQRIWGKFLWTNNEGGLGNSNRTWKNKDEGIQWKWRKFARIRVEILPFLQARGLRSLSPAEPRSSLKELGVQAKFDVKMKDLMLKAPRREKTF